MKKRATAPLVDPFESHKLDAMTLMRVFNDQFLASHNTVLVAGGNEPLYLPASDGHAHSRIIFNQDFAASALHEVSHWCIAGADRRRRQDYGYWYEPDGRNVRQQLRFEQVEIKPQALEWILSVASGRRFRISADNLDGSTEISENFRRAVCVQARRYCKDGLPPRAGIFAQALAALSGVKNYLDIENYRVNSL